MLRNGVQMKMSEYSKLYDLIVAKEHFLRKIKENIDFSFVNPMLKGSYCEKFGRPAKEPEMMFKALFLKKFYDLSDEILVESIKVNMAFKYFLNLMPEDEVFDSSLLTKFRKTHITEDVLEEMLAESIAQAVAKGLVRSTAIIVDSTHSKASAKQETPTQILRRLSKELRKEIYNTQFSLSGKFPEKPEMTADLTQELDYTKQLITVLEADIVAKGTEKAKKLLKRVVELANSDKIKGIQSLADQDAKLGHKSESNSFFGYKNHLAMTEERLITGIVVTTGEADDGKQLTKLIEQSQENGIKVDEVIGDTAYSSATNIAYTNDKNIKLVAKLHPAISNPHEKKRDGFTYNKDADTYSCPAGHLSISKSKQKGKKENNTVITYNFSKVQCKKCPFADDCPISKKSRAFSVTIPKDIHKSQLEFQNSDYFKIRAKQRYKIEAKNAECKRYHGLETADSKGLKAMSLQTYLTAFVLNTKRILKLQSQLKA